MIASEKYAQPLAASIRLSPFLMGNKPPIRMGGGYGDLGNLEKIQFSHKRTCNVDEMSRCASFFCLKGNFLPFLAQFWLSKALFRLVSECFQPSKVLPRVPLRIFGFWECSRDFPSVFSAFKSVLEGFLARIRRSGAFPRLSRRIFDLWERFCGFASAFLTLGRTPEAPLAAISTFGRVPTISPAFF